MAAFAGDVSVFAHTTLDTRIAMNVAQDITAGTFKRDFERVHYSCLPNSGEIQANGIMVKRKSCFYHLPDSLPIKYAFHGMRSTWFLRVEASHIKNLYISRLPKAAATTLSEPQDPMTCNAKDKPKENSEENTIHISKKKKKILNEKYMQNTANGMQERCSCKFEENPTGTTNKSQVVMPENEVQNPLKPNANSVQGSLNEMSISVTGIINKYFSSPKGNDNFVSPSHSDATSSRAVHKEIEDQSNTPKTPPNVLRAPSHVDLVPKTTGDRRRRESKVRKRLRVAASHGDLVSETSRDKRKESKVRNRLLVASQGLGMSADKCSPAISLCRFKDAKLLQHKSQTKGSLFEISDSDD